MAHDLDIPHSPQPHLTVVARIFYLLAGSLVVLILKGLLKSSKLVDFVAEVVSHIQKHSLSVGTERVISSSQPTLHSFGSLLHVFQKHFSCLLLSDLLQVSLVGLDEMPVADGQQTSGIPVRLGLESLTFDDQFFSRLHLCAHDETNQVEQVYTLQALSCLESVIRQLLISHDLPLAFPSKIPILHSVLKKYYPSEHQNHLQLSS